MNARIEHHIDDIFKLAGRMDFDNVGALLTDGQFQFTGHDKVIIDLTGADCASTAGLALLLEWSTWCQTQSIKLRYKNPHTKLDQIIRMNNLEQVLSISS